MGPGSRWQRLDRPAAAVYQPKCAGAGRARRTARTGAKGGVDLDIVLGDNPIPYAYKMAFLVNFLRGPVLKQAERTEGIKRPEWTVLLCLSLRDGLTAQEIAQITGQTKVSLSRAVHALLAREAIARRGDADDRRRRSLHLTAEGRAIFERILPGFVSRERAMLAALSPRERDQLDRLLRKMVAGADEWAKVY